MKNTLIFLGRFFICIGIVKVIIGLINRNK